MAVASGLHRTPVMAERPLRVHEMEPLVLVADGDADTGRDLAIYFTRRGFSARSTRGSRPPALCPRASLTICAAALCSSG